MKRTALFSFILLGLLSASVLLARPVAAMTAVQFQDNVAEEDTSQEKFTYSSTFFIAQSLNQFMAGCAKSDCGGSPILDEAGAIPTMGKMIAFTFTPVASTNAYAMDVLQDMDLAEDAYAQGLGFSSLEPVLELWKIFRDISYVFFVFIFLIIGFAIMFRKNLGGQTAVTIQQALPRIIVALLAVSFSYAIAGLMIEVMWLVMYFLITMFAASGLLEGTNFDSATILNYDIFQLFWGVITNDYAGQAAGTIGQFVEESFGNEGLNDLIGEALQNTTNVLGTLIIFVAILFAMFKTFFSLIKVYLEIILSIIFAPIILMMGAINGNTFGNWLKGLIANLAVFPVLLVFILIGFMLINQGTGNLQTQLQSGGFVPPFIPGRSNSQTIGIIGGLAAILLLPEVVGIVGKYKPASIFQEFGGKALANLQPGWSGGELVPGVKFTRMPGVATAYSDTRRLAVGTEEFRKRQKDIELHGGIPQAGGLMGGIVNPIRGALGYAQEQATKRAQGPTADSRLADMARDREIERQNLETEALAARAQQGQRNPSALQRRIQNNAANQSPVTGKVQDYLNEENSGDGTNNPPVPL